MRRISPAFCLSAKKFTPLEVLVSAMELEGRIKAYRFVAYSAVTFSVVAVLSVCITLPMVYNYVQYVRRQMHSEVNYCKVGRMSG